MVAWRNLNLNLTDQISNNIEKNGLLVKKIKMNWNIVLPSIETTLVFAITVYLVRKYADLNRTPYVVMLMTVIGWFMGFSMIVFIPLDIYLTVT